MADLQAGFRDEASPGARAAQLQLGQPVLNAGGQVAIERAAVSVDADGVVTVWSGTVAVESLATTRAFEGSGIRCPRST